MSTGKNLNYANVKNALSIIEKTRDTLLFSGDTSVDNVLFPFHYVVKILGDMDDIKWAESEIHGYAYGDELPSYRKRVYGRLLVFGTNTPHEALKKELHHDIRGDILQISHLIKNTEEFLIGVVGNDTLETVNAKYGLSLTKDQITIQIPKAILVTMLGNMKLEMINKLDKLEIFARSYLETHKKEAILDEEMSIINYDPKKIFIVHGRDEIAKTELYAMLSDNLKLEPIILNDQANGGKTLIEKFENHTLKVGFVFVLLTPDDFGCLKSDFDKYLKTPTEAIKKLMVRARENVIYELGYFVGSLGRTRVCCIQKGEAELVPSDLHGLVTIRYKDSVRDKYLDIEKELKNVGYLK